LAQILLVANKFQTGFDPPPNELVHVEVSGEARLRRIKVIPV